MSTTLDRPGKTVSAPLAAEPAPPERGFSFTDWQVANPTSPPPGDKLDSEFDHTNAAVAGVLSWAEVSLNSDGTLRPGSVGSSQMVSGLFDDIATDIINEVQPLVDQAQASAFAAYGSEVQCAGSQTDAANSRILAGNYAIAAGGYAETANAAANRAQADAGAAANSAVAAANSENHASGDAALAEDWGIVSQAWAEHMPDTIPPNILAVMGITGDHWSARWWANHAQTAGEDLHEEIICDVQHYWMGAYADNPTIDQCGQPVTVGATYYNTTNLKTMVFNGDQWKDVIEPVPGKYQSYVYFPTVNTTVFTGADHYGNALTIDPTTDTSAVFVNGVRTLETEDYTAAVNTVTLNIAVGSPNVVEILVLAQYVPSLPHSCIKLDTTGWLFNGTATAFPLLDGSGNPIAPPTAADCLVWLDGIAQQPGNDYTVAAETITFVVAPKADQSVWMIAGLPLGSVASDAPPPRITGSRGDGTALSQLLAVLERFGLIINETVA